MKEEKPILKKEQTGDWASIQLELAMNFMERSGAKPDRAKVKEFMIAYMKKWNQYPECGKIINWFHFRTRNDLTSK